VETRSWRTWRSAGYRVREDAGGVLGSGAVCIGSAQVEDDGRQIGVGLKFGVGATDIHDYYIAISEAFALLDRGEELPEELVATLNERYAMIKGILPREQ
jgi:hypothetical protein